MYLVEVYNARGKIVDYKLSEKLGRARGNLKSSIRLSSRDKAGGKIYEIPPNLVLVETVGDVPTDKEEDFEQDTLF